MSIPQAIREAPAGSVALREVVTALDAELRTLDIPDFPGAMNGLQFGNDGNVTRIAVAVDASLAAVSAAAAQKADLLIVHHGLFWSGAQPIVGIAHQKYRALLGHNVAVYSTHLPLDAHPTLGNNVLLAEALGLTPTSGFGRFKSLDIAVAGDSDVESETLVARTTAFSARYGGSVRTSVPAIGRRTRKWAIVTGGGASTDTLAEARARGIDTLIVGEGPHHTTVEAREHDLLVIYAGHYATETLGVQALGKWLEARFGLPWSFLHLPTGS